MIEYGPIVVSIGFMRIVVPLVWAIGGILWNWEHVKEYFAGKKYHNIKNKCLILFNQKDDQ